MKTNLHNSLNKWSRRVVNALATNLMLAIAIIMATACNPVHEFPGDPDRHVILDLTYQTGLPEFAVTYPSTNGRAEDFKVRYLVRGFRSTDSRGFSRIPSLEREIIADWTGEYDRTIELDVVPGDWQFIVFTEFVQASSHKSYFYDSSDFADIQLKYQEGYVGNSDLRSAFRGVAEATISDGLETTHVVVDCVRPLAKYGIVSTDLSEFIEREIVAKASRDGQDAPVITIDIQDYDVEVAYAGYVPFAFNMFTNKPSDSTTGLSFKGIPELYNEEEVMLAFDYLFVNGTESSTNVYLRVYERATGTLVASAGPITLPLKRSYFTIVRGQFLTTTSSGGIGISPGFNGEFNYPVN
jgi:hypothetical protein